MDVGAHITTHSSVGLVVAALGFPAWLRVAHLINLFFIGFLVRSGIQILGAYPRLYWNENCTPGTEWLKLTRKRLPTDRVWTTLEQEEDVSPWLAQPGGNSLGIGRHWHFFSVLIWILNGVVYVALLFITGEWQRLIPTSWSIVPDAWRTFLTYATFHTPPASDFHPYDPLQQLTYAAVVFLLGPFLILTGAAQSPAIQARFPWYARLFGGRQGARSLHFLGLLAVVAFTVLHTALVFITGIGHNFGDIVLGYHGRDEALAVRIGLSVIAVIFILYGLSAWYSRAHPRAVQRALHTVIGPVLALLSYRTRSRQEYKREEISPVFLVNGDQPATPEYLEQLWADFAGYRLEVRGLVGRPLSLSLDELRALPKQTQITKHNCIQGWTGIAEWGGVRLRDVLERCQPASNARFLIVTSYSLDKSGQPFYESLAVDLARHPQTLLAYEMNGAPLSLAHGAPLRLRVETQLGFKMVKWVRSIELVEDYASIGAGMGGSREDNMYYEQSASA
jgi:sulfoxide reductase catalytic subunit YedY